MISLSQLIRIALGLAAALTALAGGGLRADPVPVPAAPAPKAETNLARPWTDARSWLLNLAGTATATVQRSPEKITVTTTGLDGTNWHVQLNQALLPLQDGQAYTLTFKAKADRARQMDVSGIVLGGDYHTIGLRQTASLTSEWQSFQYTFVAKDVGLHRVLCPQFQMGDTLGTVTVTGLSLTPAAPGAPLTPPLPDPPYWLFQRFDPAQATSQSDGTMQVTTITATDGEPWHVQYGRGNAPVKDGVTYTVRLRAKADAPRDIMLGGGITDGDYHPIFDQQVLGLAPTWRDYEMKVTPHASAGHPVGFPQFLMGKQTGTVWIDKVSVQSGDDSPTPAAAASVPAPLTPALPQAGEIRVEGMILAGGFGPTGFSLLADRIIHSDGTATALPKPRPKRICLSATTLFQDAQEPTDFPRASLQPGQTVSVIGPDAGVGKELPARLVLR